MRLSGEAENLEDLIVRITAAASMPLPDGKTLLFFDEAMRTRQKGILDTYRVDITRYAKSKEHAICYHNAKVGEVDFLVDNTTSTKVIPFEVKSGEYNREHAALDKLFDVRNYEVMTTGRAGGLDRRPCKGRECQLAAKAAMVQRIYY